MTRIHHDDNLPELGFVIGLLVNYRKDVVVATRRHAYRHETNWTLEAHFHLFGFPFSGFPVSVFFCFAVALF